MNQKIKESLDAIFSHAGTLGADILRLESQRDELAGIIREFLNNTDINSLRDKSIKALLKAKEQP